MSVGTPKSQAKEPIQLDVIIVCRKTESASAPWSIKDALTSARQKLARLEQAGFDLSRNDRKVVFFGQLLTTLDSDDTSHISQLVESELQRVDSSRAETPILSQDPQMTMF